jgi:hypothetical protein
LWKFSNTSSAEIIIMREGGREGRKEGISICRSCDCMHKKIQFSKTAGYKVDMKKTDHISIYQHQKKMKFKKDTILIASELIKYSRIMSTR